MAVRFRFRSSVKYESVDIEGKSSISVRDLKSKILHNNNLNICQDFDLLFSDALTGQVYDENSQVPSSSSVIIKRVPKGSVHPHMVGGEHFDSFDVKDANVVKASVPGNLGVDSFDDFGAELCPILEASTSDSGPGAGKKLQFITSDSNNEVTGCLDVASVRCEKPEASELSEAIPRGSLYYDKNECLYQRKSMPSVGEFKKAKMVVDSYPQDTQNVGLPAELKCSLCDMFFTDAVMIPCCQHSFCEKCIHLSLVEKGRCPRCLSTKYKVEDLLPNVSLRQAIKRFLESQILISSDNAFGYAPDVESGIQVKEMSCAVSNQQREAQLPHSPCTTGKCSNQIISNAVGGKSSFSPKLKHNAERHGALRPLCLERQPVDSVADFQGENQPIYEEVESTIKRRRALQVHTAGLDRSFMEAGRYRKGNRTCYMCGSPDHFIRDCPAASSPNPMLQTGNGLFTGVMPGYLNPYWNGPPISQTSPFGNPYGNHFNATMVLPTTYAVPSYMPGMTPFSGFTRIGAPTSVARPGAEWHLGLSDCKEHTGREGRQKLSHDNLMRQEYFNGGDEDGSHNKQHHSNEADRSRNPGLRDWEDEQDSASRFKECLTGRPHQRHQHCSYSDEPEKSSSEVENMPSIINRNSKKRHKHCQKKSEKHRDGREQGGGNYSHTHHQSTKADVKRKNPPDLEREKWKRHGQSGSGLEASSCSDHKRRGENRDSSYSSRHSRHNSKCRNNEPSHERWRKVSRSDEDHDEERRNHKQKRRY